MKAFGNALVVLGAAVAILWAACSNEEKRGAEAQAAQATAPPPLASAAPAAEGAKRLEVVSGKGTFLIDAPLEKIKGASEEAEGFVDLTPADLRKTRGELRVALTSLKTSTFGDEGKDGRQTEHARNWMEVGPESPKDAKERHAKARFVIKSIETDTPKLADLPEKDGKRTAKLKAVGDLTIHGVTVSRSVPLVVEFSGPPEAPTEVSFRTEQPMSVSLKEHDIKPRDTLGKFLDGALEKIGQKIDDNVQVSIEATAKKKS